MFPPEPLRNTSRTRNFALLRRGGVILPTIKTVGYLTRYSYLEQNRSYTTPAILTADSAIRPTTMASIALMQMKMSVQVI